MLGAGSFGTTMASLLADRNETTLWARSPATAREITEDGTNAAYLPGFALHRPSG